MDKTDIFIIVVYYTLVLLSSAWISLDSAKVQLSHYQTPFSYNPWVVWFIMIPFWYITMPWYLVIRHRIKRDLIPMKNPNVVLRYKYGLRSRQGVNALIVMGASLLIIGLMTFVFKRPPIELASWPRWIFWTLYIISLGALLAIPLSATYLLVIIILGWLRKEPYTLIKSEHGAASDAAARPE